MGLNLLLFTALFLMSPAWAQCPPGAVQGLTAYDCYVFGTVKVPWYDALERCKAQNGVLSSVDSNGQNRFLVEHVRKESPHWLGASSKVVSSNWTWLDGEKPLEYAKWAEGHPLNTSACLALDVERSNWTSEDCTSEHLYVCKVPTTTVENWGYKKRQRLSALNTSLSLSNCSTSDVQRAVQLLEQQYSSDTEHITTEPATWVNALRLCKQWGGDLVSIHSDAEFIELTAFFKTRWTQETRYIIGYYYTKDVGWRWTTGETNDYVHTTFFRTWMWYACAYAYTTHEHNSIGWSSNACDKKDNLYNFAICQRPI